MNAHATAEAAAAGEVELEVGDPPLALAGRVLRAGRSFAVVQASGVEVVLTSRRVLPYDVEHLSEAGIEPAERASLLVKSAVGWRTAFEEPTPHALYLDTPGPCACRLERFEYKRAPRPLAPLDDV